MAFLFLGLIYIDTKMNRQTYLANRFREVILNGTWIANTNFKKELENLDWKTATTQFQNLNTISVLAQHIHIILMVLKIFFWEVI